MSLSDIKIQIQELYGAEISESLISRVTDNIMDEVRTWGQMPKTAKRCIKEYYVSPTSSIDI